MLRGDTVSKNVPDSRQSIIYIWLIEQNWLTWQQGDIETNKEYALELLIFQRGSWPKIVAFFEEGKSTDVGSNLVIGFL